MCDIAGLVLAIHRPNLAGMTTLADVRARIRKDLHDPSSERWTDSQLDRHIERALNELSIAIPREATADIATTPGSRDISIASLTALVDVEAVEYPAGQFPPAYIGFSRWDDDLSLHLDSEPDGDDATVRYTAHHTLDGSGATLPPLLEDVLAMGAGGYAALELANFGIDRLNVGGGKTVEEYSAWGRAALTAFRQLLRDHARRNAVRPRRLYLPTH